MPEPTQPKPDSLAPHAVLTHHYQQHEDRERLVRSLFDNAAPDYDRLSRLLSFGSDRWYRRRVLQRLGLDDRTQLLDVATGTGLIAHAALAIGCSARNIIGLDPSAGMLSAHSSLGTIALVRGRGEQLPFSDGRFGLVTMGYALRHVADLRKLFGEFHRVLKPGGRVLILEITRPRSRVLQHALRFYFARVVPILLGKRRRERSAELMDYYWSTIEACVPPETVAQALADSGFTQAEARATGPILTDYSARKD